MCLSPSRVFSLTHRVHVNIWYALSVGQTRLGEDVNISFRVPSGIGEKLMVFFYDQSGVLFLLPTFSYSAPAISSISANGRNGALFGFLHRIYLQTRSGSAA